MSLEDNEYYEDEEEDLDLNDHESDSEKQRKAKLMLSDEPPNEALDGVSSPTPPRLNRRSTLGTAETKSIMKKRSTQWQEAQQPNNDSLAMLSQPQHEEGSLKLWGPNENTWITGGSVSLQQSKKKLIMRRQTQSPQKLLLQIPEDLKEDEGPQDAKLSAAASKPKKPLGLMSGLISCYSKKVSRKELIETEVNLLLQKHKILIKPEPSPYMSAFQPRLNSEHHAAQKAKLQSKTVKAKSEQRKTLHLQRHNMLFKEEELKMKDKRSKFFERALKDIGKTAEQLGKEAKLHAETRRVIPLNPYFKTTKQSKKLLRRTGSLDFDKDQRKERAADLDNSLLMNDSDNEEFGPSPSQMGDRDFEQELKKIKDALNYEQNMKELEMVPDMDEVLKDKKKKLIVKMKNHVYPSIPDIFENRDEAKVDEVMNAVNVQTQKKRDPLAFIRSHLPSLPTFSPKRAMPYQRKVIKSQKKFLEELFVSDLIDSDDNQDEILKRLEDGYNFDHRSHIHVTGSLSLVINPPIKNKRMLNSFYYENAEQERKYPKLIEEPPQSFLMMSKEGSDNDSVHNMPHSVRSVKVIDLNQSQEVPPIKTLGADLKLRIRRTDTKLSGGGTSRRSNKSRGGSKGGSVNGSVYRRTPIVKGGQIKQQKHAQQQGMDTNRSKNSTQMNKSALTNKIVQIPRPELLTDKQILKRLNKEVLKSRVFSHLQQKNLPQHIYRRLGNPELLIPIKKKKKKKAPNQLFNLVDGDISSDDQHDLDFHEEEEHFFLDRHLDFHDEIWKAKHAALSKPIDQQEWSGQDVFIRYDPYKARIALKSLSSTRIWPKGSYGDWKRCRVAGKKFIKSSFIDNFMTLCVFANTIVLSIDYYGISQEATDALTICNTVFTVIFAVEMGLKLLFLGPVKYLKDRMNYMDGAIVILSLVEMIFMSGKGALSALRSIRIIRTFRVLRVARLLRGLKSMVNILQVIQRSVSSFIYLAMLFLIFIFIFALLGMQIFGGQFDNSDAPNRFNFDNFNNAFVTSFILFSMENWNAVLYEAAASNVSPFISAIYLVSCIFIGNFMILNLFLAILLDSFTSVEEEDHETSEKKAAKEQMRMQELSSKEGEEYILGLESVEMDLVKNKLGVKSQMKKKKKKKRGNQVQPTNNILDESIEIDQETLTSKKEEVKTQKQILFKNIGCQKSIYLFSQQNYCRKRIYQAVTDMKFESVILVFIVTSSIKLMYDTYMPQEMDPEDPRVFYSAQLDFVFTSCFALEMLLKIIAFGFVMDNNSYLRESWNQIDFFIVVTSLFDATFSNVNVPVIKILRLLRILRPLRFISHNSDMKTIVIALLSSMGAIFNVGIVVIAVFLMFAILGVNLFAGKLQMCSVDAYNIGNELECFKNRGEWGTYKFNFDSVPNGMITLFVVSTVESWPDIMYQYTDITAEGGGPKYGSTPPNAYFFVVFVFIGAYFFMNLFVGVLFMNFEAAQRDEAEALQLDKSESKWIDMMKMIVNTRPDIIKIPNNRVSQFVYQHTKADSKFDIIIMVCIILNMLSMAISFEGQPALYTRALEVINYVFTTIFAFEMLVKMIALGWGYFTPGWNKFDLFVVLSSFLDIIMGQLSTSTLRPLRVAPQLARVLRVLRVSRLLKLLNKYRGLQALIQTIIFSLPSLMNVFALLTLVYFIFAVLGVFMFGTVTQGEIIDPVYMNFSNFSQALIILFRISTGEDWPKIMNDVSYTGDDCIEGINCGTELAPLFFIMFVMICSYVMLNLFVLIIIQQFETYYLPQENILQQFKDDLGQFKKTWMKYSKELGGQKIQAKDLVNFFQEVDGNLGMKNETLNGIMRNLVKMNLEADEEGSIYFNELLFKAMKRIYGKERTNKRVLIECEVNALEKIYEMKDKQIMKLRKVKRQEAVAVNPFLTVMYKSMSFKAWKREYELNITKRKDEAEFGLDRESSDEEEHNHLNDDYEYVTEKDESCEEDDILQQIKSPKIYQYKGQTSDIGYKQSSDEEEEIPPFEDDLIIHQDKAD